MRFKIIGIALLLAAVYLLGYGFVSVKAINNPAAEIQIYAAAAIFLAMLVRIFQAEKHHRDEMRADDTEEAEEEEE